MPTIPTNLPQPPRRVFALATPRHLFMKLHWELDGLRRSLEPNQDDLAAHLHAAYFAFNFAVTAWHLSDWTWTSIPKNQRKEVADFLKIEKADLDSFQKFLRRSRELEICREIANGSKHMEDRGDKSIRASLNWQVKRARVGSMRAGDPLASYTHELVIHDGERVRSAVEVFETTIRFWRVFLAEIGFLEAEFISGDNGELS